MEQSEPGSRSLPKTASRLVWGGLIGVLVVVAGAGVLSLARRHAGSAARLPILGQVTPFQLTERSGRPFPSDELRGSIWIADFVFTRCASICPLLTARMSELQPKLGIEDDPKMRLVSFSVDPAHDTPEILRAYAQSHRASEQGWFFLTGERGALYDLIKDGFRLSVAQRDDGGSGDPNEMITHSDRFVLVDREGRIRGYYHGNDDDSLAHLLDDVARLRQETP